MAYYNYKRVVYRDDYEQAKVEIEERDGEEFENEVDYDGDAWVVVEYLLDKYKAHVEELTVNAERLLTLASKWCPVSHHDWIEIKKMAKAMGKDDE